ncbi:lipid-binding SYLF domain-containing protein [Aquisphaera insulae]|uniref:lipid-binding SYLF domain-containing protein n=1 Tax=Aquisphaera insulae TaxID=2712864 RepID=UPI0020301F36|nr:YSC84-related protein [Aquisphaera insulae]
MSTSRLATGLVLVASLASAPAMAQKPAPESTVTKSLMALSDITRDPKTGMPQLVMRKAHAIAIFPDMFKMGFIFGVRGGRGVLLVKQPDGSWSNPVFLHLFGGSFGAQAGAQSTDMILVFQSPRGLERFLKGKGKMTLGMDAGVAAGPTGKRFEASTDVALKSEILSYSNSRGIFAGVSAEGGTLQVDWKANTMYYGQPASPGAILAINSTLPVPASAIPLQEMLAEKTAMPTRVAVRPKSTPVIVEEGDEVVYDDPDSTIQTEPEVRRSTPTQSPAPRREVKPKPAPVEPADDADDLDAIPSARPKKKAPALPNDEDLPEAVPGPATDGNAPATSSGKKPRSGSGGGESEVPRLEAPRSGTRSSA